MKVMPRAVFLANSRNYNSIHEMHPTQTLVILSLLIMILQLTAEQQHWKAALESSAIHQFHLLAASSDARLLFYTGTILLCNLRIKSPYYL
jgi:hypothetical protein